MPHAHQPGEEEQHQQPLARTDQPPTAFPAHASEVERHRSERARARVTRKATTTYQPSTAPLLALPPPQQSAGDESNGRGRHWNSSDVTARSLPSPTSPSSLGPFPCERDEKGKRKARAKSRDTYGSRAAQSGGPFFFFLSFTPRTTNHRCHHHHPPASRERDQRTTTRPHGNERRAAAGSSSSSSTGLALASGAGGAFAGGGDGGPGTGDLPRPLLSKAARTWRGGGVAWRERPSWQPQPPRRCHGTGKGSEGTAGIREARGGPWVMMDWWSGLGSEDTRTREGRPSRRGEAVST